MHKNFNFDSVSGIDILEKVKSKISFSLDRFAPINPSSRHLLGQEAASVIDSCTTNMMKAIGRQDFSNGVWTSSATESHYLIANSIKPKRIVVPRGSRLSLLNSAKTLCLKHDSELITPKFDKSYGFDLSLFENLDEGDVLFMEMSCAEVGFIQDLDKISSAVKKRGVKVLLDISSSAGWVKINHLSDFAEWITFSFFRFGGPPGVGFIASKNNNLKPLFPGVEQEGFRGGCVSLSLIEGASVALHAFEEDFKSSIERKWDDAVLSLGIFLKEELQVNEFKFKRHLPHSLSSWSNRIDLDAFRMNLSLEGIYIGTGPACISGAGKKSQILEDLNISTMENLLISPDLNLKLEDLDYLYEKFSKAWGYAKIT